MIKKIYAILFALSLITTVSAFGMKKDTHPCDLCSKPQELLNVLNRTNWPTHCQHILCNTCDETITNTDLRVSSHDGLTDGFQPYIDAPYYEELDEFSYECKYCYYFKCIKSIKCEQREQPASFGDMIGQSAEWIKANCPNRVLPNITPEPIVPQKPAANPTLLPTSDTKTKQSINRCDFCNENIGDSNPIKTEHTLNKLEGTCSYSLCNTCQEYTEIFKESCPNESTYDNCKTCFYFNTLGLDLKWQPTTYPCDNCYQEHTKLTDTKEFWDDKNGLKCNHILCPECQNTINWKKIENDPIWWNCSLCSYFYHHHNQQCWQLNQKPSLLDGITTMRAKGFKIGYPNRILSKVTEATLFPNKPIKLAKKPIPQNPNDPTQHVPAHQNPDNPPTTNNFVVGNKIKWLSLTCVAGVVCYGAYKTYHWWKGEDAQEKDADDE